MTSHTMPPPPGVLQTVPREFSAPPGVLQTVPRGFSLHASGWYPGGLGVYTQDDLPPGRDLGPFTGVLRQHVEDPVSAWEVSL